MGCSKGRMTGRMDEKKRDVEKEGFRTGVIIERMDSGLEGYTYST